MQVVTIFSLLSCTREPWSGVPPDAPTWYPVPEPNLGGSPPPDPGGEPESGVPIACDLPLWPVPEAQRVVTPEALEGSTILGEPLSFLGSSVAIVPAESGPSRLVVGAPGTYSSEPVETIPPWTTYSYYLDWTDLYEIDRTVAEIWVFDSPLPEGTLGRADARSTLIGTEDLGIMSMPGEGWSLTVGDFTGDGVADIASMGADVYDLSYSTLWPSEVPLQIIEMPPPPGEHLLSEIAWAEERNRGGLSSGDWDHDGAADLAFHGPYNSGFGLDGSFTGVQILGGPLSESATDGERLAWVDLSAAAPNVSATVYRSALIPDTTGDERDDLLIGTDVLADPDDLAAGSWDYEGWYSGVALFEGGGVEMSLDSALALLNTPCAYLTQALPTGDMSGDGKADVVLWSAYSSIGSGGIGIVWVVSRLSDLALSPPTAPLSISDLSDAIVLGHEGVNTNDVESVDLNQDGISELLVLTETDLHVFIGPLQGMLDINDADIIITDVVSPEDVFLWIPSLAAGDLDGDNIPEIVVGDPMSGGSSGEVRVFSGISLLQALL